MVEVILTLFSPTSSSCWFQEYGGPSRIFCALLVGMDRLLTTPTVSRIRAFYTRKVKSVAPFFETPEFLEPTFEDTSCQGTRG